MPCGRRAEAVMSIICFPFKTRRRFTRAGPRWKAWAWRRRIRTRWFFTWNGHASIFWTCCVCRFTCRPVPNTQRLRAAVGTKIRKQVCRTARFFWQSMCRNSISCWKKIHITGMRTRYGWRKSRFVFLTARRRWRLPMRAGRLTWRAACSPSWQKCTRGRRTL